MLYLIGGTPRCGKSTIGRKIAQKLLCSCYHTDYIHSAIKSKITQETLEKIFDKKWHNAKNWENNDTRFSVFSEEEQIEYYRIKAEYSIEGIKNICEYALSDNEDIVLEGYHLRPQYIKDIIIKHPGKIKYILLYKSNKQEIEDGLHKSNDHNDRLLLKTKDKVQTFPLIANFIHTFGKILHNEAEKNMLDSYDMSSGEFHNNIENILHHIILK